MFIGIYKKDNKQYNYIYFDNKNGCTEFLKDTWGAKDIQTLSFKIRGKNYQERRAEAREIAIFWQNNFSCYDWSYSELATIYEFFEKVGKRYGLIKEFKENAII